MRPTRKCEFCGKTFVPRSGMQKYCSEDCQAEAKRLRKKRQQDLINGIEPIMDLQSQEYLTFSKAAVLMGCTRQYVYKLVANGKLKASRLSNRMAFVRKSDIEKMFESNPYKRVIPKGKSWLSQKAKTEKPTQKQNQTKGKEENEVLDKFIHGGHEALSSFAKTDRVNFNEKESASRLSNRMAFVRKSDIEKMFESNPYKRVIPKGKSWLSQKAKTEKPTQKQNQTKGKEENEVLDKFIHGGHEALSSFAKTDRVNFNEKESASMYYASWHLQ